MTEESDILGLLIKALSEGDAFDQSFREETYSRFRTQFSQDGYSFLPPKDALPLLENAITKQEAYWTSQAMTKKVEVETPRIPPANKPSLFDKIKKLLAFNTTQKSLWPLSPPGPLPPDAAGPFSDPIHIRLPVYFLNREFLCRIYYRYDPACDFHAEIEDLDFSFKTRSHSLQYALQHLDQAFASKRLSARIAGLASGAKWENDDHNCEAVFLPNSDRLHHAFENL